MEWHVHGTVLHNKKLSNSIYPVSLIGVLSDSAQIVGSIEVVSSEDVSWLFAAPDLSFVDAIEINYLLAKSYVLEEVEG